MSRDTASCAELFRQYKRWIISNPESASDFEGTAKIISYFIGGRIKESHEMYELVHSLSNLLVVFNDQIIMRSQQMNGSCFKSKLKFWLTIVDCVEVFMELSSSKTFGKYGKWTVIVCIQLFKSLARLALLYNHNEQIVFNQPFVRMRKNGEMLVNRGNTSRKLENGELNKVSFTLKQSGRVIRKVESSPPIPFRTWKPLNGIEKAKTLEVINEEIPSKSMIAETVYIVKPLAHLGLMSIFGTDSWKPWMAALIMDVFSLKRHSLSSLSTEQQQELDKRWATLLMYLLRSPFYDNFSKMKIAFVLNKFGNVPILSVIARAILRYIPLWQQTYFHMWSA